MATEFPNKITFKSIYTQIIVMFYLIFLSSLKKKKKKSLLLKGHVFTQFWNTHLTLQIKTLSAISTNSCYYICLRSKSVVNKMKTFPHIPLTRFLMTRLVIYLLSLFKISKDLLIFTDTLELIRLSWSFSDPKEIMRIQDFN